MKAKIEILSLVEFLLETSVVSNFIQSCCLRSVYDYLMINRQTTLEEITDMKAKIEILRIVELLPQVREWL